MRNGGRDDERVPPQLPDVMRECSGSDTPVVNVTEYLNTSHRSGSLIRIYRQSSRSCRKRVWAASGGCRPEAMAEVVQRLKSEDGRFHMEGGVGPITSPGSEATRACSGRWRRPAPVRREGIARACHVRAAVSQRPLPPDADPDELLSVLGPGLWTDYGRELCRGRWRSQERILIAGRAFLLPFLPSRTRRGVLGCPKGAI